MKLILSLASALLLLCAFSGYGLEFFAFFGFVPLFFAIQDKYAIGNFRLSFLCGFLFYLGVLYWLYHVTIIGLIVLCLYLAIYFGIFARLFSNLPYIFIPFLWVGIEYMQAHLFTGFGWTSLGYSQYKNLPLIQIADRLGVYGVSFIIMASNVAIYRLVRKRSFIEAIIVAALILVTFYYGNMRLSETEGEKSIRVSVIQGNIPQEKKWDTYYTREILERFVSLTEMAAKDGPDLIVWPETAFPGFFVKDSFLTEEVLNLADRVNIPILLGANTEEKKEEASDREQEVDLFMQFIRGADEIFNIAEEMRYYNSAILISEKGQPIGKYDKIHLVPFGEYVPFSDVFPFLRRLILGELGEFSKGKDFRVFQLNTKFFNLKPKFSVLICFEDIFPELAREFVHNGAQFLVVITNDAWYGDSEAAFQHAACSVFRAIENRVPIVRCANTGYSCFIDSKGQIYDSVTENGSHLFVTGHRTAKVIF